MKRLLLLLLLGNVVSAQVLPPSVTNNIRYRNIGPFRTGAWITSFAVPEITQQDHLYTFYVGTRNGGLWKTTNNGTTFNDIFPYHHTIGAVAVAPSNPAQVWVGTGESYIARSTYSGDGIYLSTDTGRSWKNVGLKETQHIVRILVHPKNSDIVYVASPGHLFTNNEERGVFKTTDGGKTWKKTFYISDSVGVIDLVMHPTNPDILYAAAYDKKRTVYTLESGGPQSAIYQTKDGGKTWSKLTGGLPVGNIGRIGIDICKTQPNIMYAVIENLNPQTGSNNTIGGEVYRTDDAGKNWRKVNRAQDNVGGKAAYSFNQITVHPTDPNKVYVTGSSVANSIDGGKTWRDIDNSGRYFFPGAFGDVRTLWIDHQNPERILFGSDGGVHISYDGGKSGDYYDNLPVGEVYALGIDMEEPYNVYAGLQDHDSWKGPSNGWSGFITLENWVTVGSDDGMYNVIDPTDSRWVYNTGQFGIHRRVDQQTGIRVNIQPKNQAGKAPYRYNWCTPIGLSPHDPKTVYTGAQVLLRSKDRGDNWEVISPDLTTNDPSKINGKGHMQYCTITSFSESPLQKGVIWIGTDDGKVWLTRNDGKDWQDLTVKVANAGGPESKWVSRVLSSAHEPGTAYVAKSGFRDDDFLPYLFKTTDYGNTWTKITTGLSNKPLNVIVEDPVNSQLLFVGNDEGVFVSINGGNQWSYLKGNMPMVPVHDLAIHPREKDLVVGTYGRGIYITDISYLQEMNASVLEKPVHLFKVESKYHRVTRTFGGNYQLYGNRHIKAPNETNGLVIHFYAKENVGDSATVTVTGDNGSKLFERKLPVVKGLNSAIWNFSNVRGSMLSPNESQLKAQSVTVTLKIGDEVLTTQSNYKGIKGWPVY
jgi:photosystem II stability/assembly factor-like uncharacterized protein